MRPKGLHNRGKEDTAMPLLRIVGAGVGVVVVGIILFIALGVEKLFPSGNPSGPPDKKTRRHFTKRTPSAS